MKKEGIQDSEGGRAVFLGFSGSKRCRCLLESLIIAFSMYSRLPMPKVDWNEENMRYPICFFPLLGAVIGGLSALCLSLCMLLDLSSSLRAAFLTALPVLVTGGIHLDGLLDTADAVNSWGSPEKRLEILKDSRSGAFAVICCGLYFVLFFGAASVFTLRDMPALTLVFMLSRALSGLTLARFPKAKSSGLLYTFADQGKTKAISCVSVGYLLFCVTGLLMLSPFLALLLIGEAALLTYLYHRTSLRMFGGITGDLAGCFLCVTELTLLITIASLSGL